MNHLAADRVTLLMFGDINGFTASAEAMEN